MVADWNLLSDDLQLTLSRAALQKAAETIAGQAELLARFVRLSGQAELAVAGHC